MKNIMVIDGAVNCAYSVYAVSDEMFAMIFPAEGQDVEFIEDFYARAGESLAGEVAASLWDGFQEKKVIQGIHGTLFYGLEGKKQFYPNKRESDLDANQSRERRTLQQQPLSTST